MLYLLTEMIHLCPQLRDLVYQNFLVLNGYRNLQKKVYLKLKAGFHNIHAQVV